MLVTHGWWVRGLLMDASPLPMLGATQVQVVSETPWLWSKVRVWVEEEKMKHHRSQWLRITKRDMVFQTY